MTCVIAVGLLAGVALADPTVADRQDAIDAGSTRLTELRAELAADVELDSDLAERIETYLDRAGRDLDRAQKRLDNGNLETAGKYTSEAGRHLDDARAAMDKESK